jgi:hypothetical protein
MIKKRPDIYLNYPLISQYGTKTRLHFPQLILANSFHTASAEGRRPGSAYERLLWRKFLVIEGKIFKPRVLHHASVVISPEQTLRIMSPASITDPTETLGH